MSERPFVDHYEILQLSPSASSETIERVYRLLAKRFHPDNQSTGDAARFSELHTAFEVLSDPERRARYDVQYDEHRGSTWRIFDQGSATDARDEDRRIFHGILALLYAARRRSPNNGGLGVINLEKMLGVPQQHLEFPMWYMKQHGWIELLDTGQWAITIEGIDHLVERDASVAKDRLLPAPAPRDTHDELPPTGSEPQ